MMYTDQPAEQTHLSNSLTKERNVETAVQPCHMGLTVQPTNTSRRVLFYAYSVEVQM